jgi:hypothetical protein
MLTLQCSSVYGPLYRTLAVHAGTTERLAASITLDREVQRQFTGRARDTPVLVDTLQGMLAAEPESLVPDAALPLCALPACRAFITRLLLRVFPDPCGPCLEASRPEEVSQEVRSALSVCAGAFASTYAACSPTLSSHTASAKRSRSARSSEGSGQPQPADER